MAAILASENLGGVLQRQPLIFYANWQDEIEFAPCTLDTGNADITTMGLNNALRNSQTQSCSSVLSRV